MQSEVSQREKVYIYMEYIYGIQNDGNLTHIYGLQNDGTDIIQKDGTDVPTCRAAKETQT